MRGKSKRRNLVVMAQGRYIPIARFIKPTCSHIILILFSHAGSLHGKRTWDGITGIQSPN